MSFFVHFHDGPFPSGERTSSNSNYTKNGQVEPLIAFFLHFFTPAQKTCVHHSYLCSGNHGKEGTISLEVMQWHLLLRLSNRLWGESGKHHIGFFDMLTHHLYTGIHTPTSSCRLQSCCWVRDRAKRKTCPATLWKKKPLCVKTPCVSQSCLLKQTS